jgi:glycerophosphoryl diester phosphodiesterase
MRNSSRLLPDATKLPLILAHRGASSAAPENTLAAFRLAIAQGADGVELDVQLTRDGVAVVMHDRTLKRTAGLRRRVSSIEASRVAELDCGSWFDARYCGERIPTLRQVLELFDDRYVVNLELKAGRGAELVDAVVEIVRARGAFERVVLSSFDHRLVRRARDVAPEIARATLMHPLDVGMPSRAALAVDAAAVVLSRRQLRRDRVDDAHRRDLAVVVYTVDAPRDVARCARFGVDAIITNDPAGTRRLLEAHRSPATG